MIDAQQYRTTVTHTETSENGSVVVITDVPAYVYEEGGEQDTVYDMDVALAIDEFVAKCFARAQRLDGSLHTHTVTSVKV